MKDKRIGQIAKMGYLQRIRKTLLEGAKGLDAIKDGSGLSRRYTSEFLKELKEKDEVFRRVDEKSGFIVWELTSKGKVTYSKNWTALQEDILNIIKKDGSYFRYSDQPSWLSQSILASPFVIMDNAAYPSNIENTLNTVKLQYETKDFLKTRLLRTISDSKKELPDDAKLIFAFEFDLSKYSKFIKGIRNFINDVKFERDIFNDNDLEFKDYEYNKLELFEAYLNNSDAFADQEYNKKLSELLKNEGFISTLVSFGLWANLLDKAILVKLDKLFKSGKDPLSNKELVKKLIIKTPEGGFFMPLYDYVAIIRILNYNNLEVRTKLLQYEEENRNRPDKSAVFKIQEEMRGKIK